jgi:hypothetical protein
MPKGMAASDYTEADLIVIRRAISRGERTVQYANRMVQYRSMEELIQAENRISQSLAAATPPATPRSKQSLIVSSKGF